MPATARALGHVPPSDFNVGVPGLQHPPRCAGLIIEPLENPGPAHHRERFELATESPNLLLVYLPRLLFPERVAAATIRGYLTQAHYSVLQWLQLGERERILVEGNEDIDRYLLDDGGAVVGITQEQIKDLAGRISARDPTAHESIFNFIRSFQAHDEQGISCRFVFTTTATLKDQKIDDADPAARTGASLPIDVLKEWSRLGEDSEPEAWTNLANAVRALVRKYGAGYGSGKKGYGDEARAALEEAVAYLDSEPSRWRQFLSSVTWQTASADLSTIVGRIVAALESDERTKALPSKLLLPRLLASVFGTAVRKRPTERLLTAADIKVLASQTEQQLESWASKHPKLSQTAALIEAIGRLADLERRVSTIEQNNEPLGRLKRRSARVMAELQDNATISFRDSKVAIRRDHALNIVKMASEGSLVVVGEAGAGKSAVLYDLAKHLEAQGDIVFVLSADTLPTIDLEVSLSKVLEDCFGCGAGYLIVDGLDAPLDDSAARQMLRALREVMNRATRWRVIASSRTFDLRARASMAELFEGVPHPSSAEPTLPLVRHYRVGTLNDVELDQLGASCPELASLVRMAPADLRELLRIPFNLKLAAKLLEGGLSTSDFQTIKTQFDLLERYWARRVCEPAARRFSREATIRSLTTEMVAARRLIASVEKAAELTNLVDLLSAQVLIHPQRTDGGTPDERFLAFSHRLIFDYAVAVTYLPGLASDLRQRLVDHPDLVLISHGGIQMYFQREWASDGSRATFWDLVIEVAATAETGEIPSVIATGVVARVARHLSDLEGLLDALSSEDQRRRGGAEKVLQHVVSSRLAIPRGELPLGGLSAGPWAELAEALANVATPAALDSAWRLLAAICEDAPSLTHAQFGRAGAAAREICRSYRTTETSWLRGVSAEMVCRTFRSNPGESSLLIREFVAEDGLAQHGHAVLHRIASAIADLAPVDPQLVADVFAAAFRHVEKSEEQTYGGGMITRLSSNRRQDYDMGLHQLIGAFPDLLSAAPIQATQALLSIMASYIEREHSYGRPPSVLFQIDTLEAHLLTDYSSTWGEHTHDEELQLLGAWENYLVREVANGSSDGKGIVAAIAESPGYAVFWRVLLRVAAGAPATAGQRLKYLLYGKALLTSYDTSEPAGEFLAAVFPLLGVEERYRIELNVLDIAGDGDVYRAEEARDRLLGCIGDPDLLSTETARSRLKTLKSTGSVPSNETALRVRMLPVVEPTDEVRLAKRGVKLERPEDRGVFQLCQRLKNLDKVASNVPLPRDLLDDSINALTELEKAADDGLLPVELRAEAGEQLARASERLARSRGLPSLAFSAIRRLLLGARKAPSPVRDSDSSSFDEHPGWGPSARVSAASGLCELASQENSLGSSVAQAVEELSGDPVREVRYQVARRIYCLRHDPSRMWRIAEQFAIGEQSIGVLQALLQGLSNVTNDDIVRVSHLVDIVHRRRLSGPGSKQLCESLCGFLADIYLERNEKGARAAVMEIASDPAAEEARWLTASARDRLGRQDAEIRKRAWGLLSGMVDEAVPSFLDAEKRLRGGEALSDEQRGRLKTVGKLLDSIAREIYFGSGALDEKTNRRESRLGTGISTYYRECSATIDRLAPLGMPNVAHNLILLLEHLCESDPAKAFLQVAAVVNAAERFGYQSDGQAERLLVQIVSRYLADHRALLREDARVRRALLDVLNTFVRVGWPESRKLTYELQTIFQ